jgi:NAD(P)-dependent dehydrogenase (short-subunit alcohol dehydrogenase family)
VVKTLATEWAANGVRVNAFIFETERSGPRASQTRDLAGPAVFLASDEAAAVSGELLSLGRQPDD